MPSPDLSLNDMPWITQHPNPGSQLAQGVAAGSQIAQTNLSRRRLEQQQQQNDMEMQLLPYKLAEAKQHQELNSLSMQAQWQQKQIMLENAKASAEASGLVSGLIRDGKYDEARFVVADTGSKYPYFPGSPGQNALEGLIDKSEGFKDRKDALAAQIRSREDQTADRNWAMLQATGMRGDTAEKNAALAAQTKLKGIEMTVEGRKQAAEIRAKDRQTLQGGVKQNDFKFLVGLDEQIKNAKSPEEAAELTERYNLARSMLVPREKATMGVEVSESAFIRSELPRILDEMASDEAMKDKGVEEKLNAALVIARSLYKKIPKRGAVTTPRPSSGSSTNIPYRYDQKAGRTVPQ